MKARPYQEETVDKVIECACTNVRGRVLVVCPPGGGKTLIGALAMRRLVSDQGLRGLAWAHRRELVGQMRDHLVECGIPENMISVVMAGDKRHNPTAPIQVGSVDTIRHRNKPLADFVISDEAHRDASDGRRALRAMYPDAFHLGLTATPVRLDGRGLQAEYDEMIVAAQPSELIAEGWLSAPTIYTVPAELLPDLKGVRKRGGDYREDELEERSNRRALIGSIVDHWLRRAERRRTLVYPVSVKHSKAIVERFRAAGVSAAHLDGDAPHAERARILAGLRDGSIPVVSSCGVLSEGFDAPWVKCIVLARATQSLALFIQQGLRGDRPWGGVESLILDHAGNVQKHGAPHADREWALDGTKKHGAASPAAAIKMCEACCRFVPTATLVCPCGNPFPVMADRVPDEKAGELVQFKPPSVSAEEKAAELAWLQEFATKRGFKEGWAERVYRAKFGEVPPGYEEIAA